MWIGRDERDRDLAPHGDRAGRSGPPSSSGEPFVSIGGDGTARRHRHRRRPAARAPSIDPQLAAGAPSTTAHRRVASPTATGRSRSGDSTPARPRWSWWDTSATCPSVGLEPATTGSSSTGSYDGTARIWDRGERRSPGRARSPGQLGHGRGLLAGRVAPAHDPGEGRAMIWDLPRYAGGARQLAALFRCRVPYRVEAERLVVGARDPAACADMARTPR